MIAGMGGALVVRILDDSAEVVRKLDECILQPQSELFKVRDYLSGHGYEVTAEEMVLEDGKFYPMMRIRPGKPYTLTDVERFYGPILTRQRHPVLLEFLKREIAAKERLLDSLKQKGGEHIRARERELLEEIALARNAMAGKV